MSANDDFVRKGVGGKFLSLPVEPHPQNKNMIQPSQVEDNYKRNIF